MEVEFHENPPKTQTQASSSIPLSSLTSALDLASQSTKFISSNDKTLTLTALSSLSTAYELIGSFLSQFEPDKALQYDGDEPMRDQQEEESKIIEEVEEGMRECVLQSKRRKRRISPSWRMGRDADRGEELAFVDPMDRRRSALDLVFQFYA